MMDIVDETLREWRRHPHQYGVNDCVLSAAAYFIRLGVNDVMPVFTGTYSDAEEALAVLEHLGGMGRAMDIVGGTLVDSEARLGRDLPSLGEASPLRGDFIGLVADADYVIPALCTGDMVAARLERGVIEIRLRFVKWQGVWRGLR